MNKQSSKPEPEEDDVDLSDLDEDDAPEFAAKLRPMHEIPEIAGFARKGGRPRLSSEQKKRRVTLMLDPDVLEHFKAGGRGWQTRINAALRRAAGFAE